MTRSVLQIRVTPTELERWKRLAGGPVSPWVKRVLGEECDRLEAVGAERDQSRADRVAEISAAFPQQVQTAAQFERRFRPDPK